MPRKHKAEYQAIPLPPSSPFSCNILVTENDDGTDLQNQFPASYRVSNDDLRAPAFPELDLISRELNVQRLHDIIHLLWLAGRPVPPRPLHYQVALGREITVTERMESHLVWGSGRIFCKPIPRYLLNTAFWERHLSCDRCRTTTTPGMINPLPNPPPTSPPSVAEAAAHQVMAGEAGPEEGDDDDSQSCGHRQPRACALGFLLSYVALIVYESDFFIAKEKHLIPNQITWPAWRQLVGEILADDTGPNTTSATPTGADSRTGITIRSTPAGTKNSRGDRNGSANRLYTFVAPRFIYGELRLNRLNLIFVARRGPLSTGFVATWHSFGSFYRDNSAWIITVAAYILLMLSAVQVGLATDRLEGNDAFQAASYGFTVFAMLVPIFSLGVLVFFSAVLWTYHVMRTRQFEAKRAKVLGRAWREEQPGRDGGIRRGSSLPLE